MRSIVCVGTAAALLVGPLQGFAGDVRVTHARCAVDVRVEARDAPLSLVLKKLADTLGFQVLYGSDSDPLITLDVTQPSQSLPSRLGPSENITMLLERDSRCPGQQRIAKVWVLPGGGPRGAGSAVAAVRQSDELDRKAQEGGEMILRAHGMDASGQPLQR